MTYRDHLAPLCSRRTAFVYHEHCFWHDTGASSVYPEAGRYLQPLITAESPESKRRLKNLLEVSGLVDELIVIKGAPAMEADLLRFHTPDYLARLKQMSDEGFGDAGECAPIRKGSYEIACRSTGQVLAAMDAVLSGVADNAYALSRPPGHHAERDRGRGFCLLGNIPVAVMTMMEKYNLSRVAVVDWDVHHGNGTEQAFLSRSDVFTLSLHHDNNYPANSGAIECVGEGEGHGYNLNVPLPAGCGIGAYLTAMEQVVLPALTQFKPDIIVVACGFDASAMDPLGCMMLNSSTYSCMTHMLLEAADELCEGRLVMVHEGGYSEGYVPFCGHAVIQTLKGSDIVAEDALSDEIAGWGQQGLQRHQAELIEQAAALIQGMR